MATLTWLFAKYIMKAPTRDMEILIMLMIDGFYLLVFWTIRKMGKDLETEEEENEEQRSNKAN